MNARIDSELKAVIVLLGRLAESGKMEPDQRDAIAQAIRDLRKAARENNPNELRKSLKKAAKIFLRKFG